MHIGIYLPDNNPITGGAYSYQKSLINALPQLIKNSKHKYSIISPFPEQYENISSLINIKTIKIPTDLQFANPYFELIQHLLRISFNKIFNCTINFDNHSNSCEFNKIFLSNKIELLWFPIDFPYPVNIPYIATVWDLQHRNQPFFPEVHQLDIWQKRENFYRVYLQRASLIIVGTETGRNEVEFFYQIPKQRIKVIPFGSFSSLPEETTDESKILFTKYGISEKFLFYPAQFWSHKNHANLLLSLKILKDKYNLHIPLVLVGSDKGNEQYIKWLVSHLELTNDVFLLGFVPEIDLITLYRNAFALVFLTFFGPDNLPPLEAFALGCPVIASNVAGAEEQLGDAALLVDPKDPELIAKTIFSLYNNPHLVESLIERGLKRSNRWTNYDYVKSISSIFDEFELIRVCWE